MGITIGILLVIIGAVGGFCNFGRHIGKMNWWAWPTLPCIPLALWGCSNLAKDRGYSSAAAYGLFVAGVLTMGFIVRGPLVIGFTFLFAVSLPVVILLILPRRSGRPGRHRHR